VKRKNNENYKSEKKQKELTENERRTYKHNKVESSTEEQETL
jgi:hypothetical protein